MRFSWDIFPNFKPSEFKCPCCGLGGDLIDENLLYILQSVRNKYGVVTITSGFRCKPYNNSLKGSVANSYHMNGKAADFIVNADKEEVMEFIKLLPGYKYCYSNDTNMGKAIHIEVK